MAPRAARLVYTAGIKTRCHTQFVQTSATLEPHKSSSGSSPPTANTVPAV